MGNQEVINAQIELIKRLSSILQEELAALEHKGRTEIMTSQIESDTRAILMVQYKNYLVLFINMIDFLTEKLETEKSQNFRFYLVHIRTLIEIFASMLYLSNQSIEKQRTTIVVVTLWTLAKTIRDKHSPALEKEYEENRLRNLDFLKSQNIELPEDYHLLSNTLVAKLGIGFPETNKMLTNEYVNNSCPQAASIPDLAKSILETFGYFSNYIHGNTLFGTNHGNENLWIIAKVQIISFSLADLIDNTILNSEFKHKISTWRRYQKRNTKDFITHWQTRSNPSA